MGHDIQIGDTVTIKSSLLHINDKCKLCAAAGLVVRSIEGNSVSVKSNYHKCYFSNVDKDMGCWWLATSLEEVEDSSEEFDIDL